MATTKVGVLGSGDVGKTLAKGFLSHGYQATGVANIQRNLTHSEKKIQE